MAALVMRSSPEGLRGGRAAGVLGAVLGVLVLAPGVLGAVRDGVLEPDALGAAALAYLDAEAIAAEARARP